jgi:hypothetical protein
MIMSINGYIIKTKLMEMGGREEILLERETNSPIIPPDTHKTDQSISEGGYYM